MSIAKLRRRDGQAFRLDGPLGAFVTAPLCDLVEAGVLASAREPFHPWRKRFTTFAATEETERLDNGLGASSTSTGSGLTSWRDRRLGGKATANPASLFSPRARRKPSPSYVALLATNARRSTTWPSRGFGSFAYRMGSFRGGEHPASPRKFALEFLGLVGLADPLRPSVPNAVKECRSAGIRVVMITGDYRDTAAAIARRAGLDVRRVVTGEALEKMSDAELAEVVGDADVFARIMQCERGNLGDDRRRRQRRAIAQGRAYRRCDGRTRNRR